MYESAMQAVTSVEHGGGMAQANRSHSHCLSLTGPEL